MLGGKKFEFWGGPWYPPPRVSPDLPWQMEGLVRTPPPGPFEGGKPLPSSGVLRVLNPAPHTRLIGLRHERLRVDVVLAADGVDGHMGHVLAADQVEDDHQDLGRGAGDECCVTHGRACIWAFQANRWRFNRS